MKKFLFLFFFIFIASSCFADSVVYYNNFSSDTSTPPSGYTVQSSQAGSNFTCYNAWGKMSLTDPGYPNSGQINTYLNTGTAYGDSKLVFTFIAVPNNNGQIIFGVRQQQTSSNPYYGYSFRKSSGASTLTAIGGDGWGSITTNSSVTFANNDVISEEVTGAGASTHVIVKQNGTIIFEATNPTTNYPTGTIYLGLYLATYGNPSVYYIDDLYVYSIETVPTPTPTITQTATISPTPTITQTRTVTQTITPTPTPAYFANGKSISITGPNCIINVGSDLWVSTNTGKVVRVNAYTGNTLASISVANQPNALTYDGTYIRTANNDGTSSQISVSGNSVIATYTICPRALFGIDYVSPYLFMADAGISGPPNRSWVWKFDASSNTIVSYTYINDNSSLGIAHDLIGYVWVFTTVGEIAKIIVDSGVVEAYIIPDAWHVQSLIHDGINSFLRVGYGYGAHKMDQQSNSITAQASSLSTVPVFGSTWNKHHFFVSDQTTPVVYALNPANLNTVGSISIPGASLSNMCSVTDTASAWVCGSAGVYEILEVTATPTPIVIRNKKKVYPWIFWGKW